MEIRTFKAKCPNCAQHLELDEEYNGAWVTCPSCDAQFTAQQNVPTQARTTPQGSAPPVQKPKRNIKLIVILLAVILLTVVFGVSMWFSSRVQDVAGAAATGIGGFLMFAAIATAVVLVFMLVLLWITFPWFVYFSLKRIERLLGQIEENTRRI